MDISEFSRQHTSQRHPWELARIKVIKDLLKKYAFNSEHILDIGSGDAFVLQELSKEFGTKSYTAIDTAYTPDIINRIKNNTIININYFPELPIKLSPKADCILFLDVLEHCADDAAVLKSVTTNQIIKKESLILISVPAFQHLFSQHDRLLNHYRRYTGKQLRNLCKQQGLSIVSSGYLFTSLLIPRLIQLLFEKTGYFKVEQSIDNWKSNKWITKGISSFLLIDYRLNQLLSKMGVRLPGLSAYCICRTSPS